MIGRRSIIGIAMLCAFVFSAFAAANASAEQRAYRCITTAPDEFSDAHCLVKNAAGPFGHELVPVGTATEIGATNERTSSETKASAVSKLKGALSGVETELQCTTVGGMGSMTNAAASVSGTGTIEYTGCTVTKPSGKGCKVNGGAVTTKLLAATTVGQAANRLKFTPNSGTEFASIKIESCSTESLNNTFPVVGSLVATTSGATTSTTHAAVTEQNTLKFGGVKAGLEGSITITEKTVNALGLT